MNTLLLTMDEPLYIPVYLEPVLLAHRDSITEIVIAPHPNEGLRETIRQRFRMFGPYHFFHFGSLFALGKVLSKLPNSLSYPLTGRYYSVITLGEEYDVPVREVSDINAPTFLQEAENMNLDLILSIACNQFVGEDLLSLPDQGAINIHGSLLPKYRGRATAFWVLFYDEEESGVTAHYMTDDYDAGEIVMQRRFPIQEDDTMNDVYWKTVDLGSDIAIDLIDRIKSGKRLERRSNDINKGEYRSLPGKTERREFIRRGNAFR